MSKTQNTQLSRHLFKYDFKWIFLHKTMFIYFAVVIALVILTKIFESDTSFIGHTIFKVCYQLGPIALLSTMICIIARSIARFRRNLYKDEAYLTHTLPVTRQQLYASKVLAILAANFLTLIILAACLYCVCDAGTLDTLHALFTDQELQPITITTLVIAALELIFFLLCCLNGVIFGHRFNNHKESKSVLLAIAFYVAAQLILLGAIYLIGLFVPAIGNLFTSAPSGLTDVRELLNICLGFYTLFVVVAYLAGKHTLARGVDLD